MTQSLQVRQEKEASFTGFLLYALHLGTATLAVRLGSPAVWNLTWLGSEAGGSILYI
jgi:hypothetical protein